MKTQNLIIGAAVVGGAIYLSRKKNTSESLQYQYRVDKVDWKNPLNPVLEIEVTVTNPTTSSINLKNIFGTVKYLGSQIGTFSVQKAVDIASLAVTKILLPVRLSIASAVFVLLRNLKMGGAFLKVQVDANYITSVTTLTDTYELGI